MISKRVLKNVGEDPILHKNTKKDIRHDKITTTDLKYTKGRDDLPASYDSAIIVFDNHHNQEEVKKVLTRYDEKIVLAPKKSVVSRVMKNKLFSTKSHRVYEPHKSYEIEEHEFTEDILHEPYSFTTLPGLFSYKSIDTGTKHLMNNVESDGETVLDLGCGYGAIGIPLAKQNNVTMVDSNQHAVQYAKKNMENNGADATVKQSYFLSNVEKEFDTIITNPPTHTSKKEYIPLIKDFKNYLSPDGTVKIVTHKMMQYEKHADDYSVSIKHVGDYKILTLKR